MNEPRVLTTTSTTICGGSITFIDLQVCTPLSMSVMSEGDSDWAARASMAPSDTGSAISSGNLVLTAPSSSLALAADLATSNLMKLGTLTLNDFLSPPYHDPPPPEVNLTLSYVARPATDPALEEKNLPAHKATPLFLLNQVCSQTLGSIEPLKYEFIDEGDGKLRQSFICICDSCPFQRSSVS